MPQVLLQNATVITKWNKFITKYDSSQNATCITKCVLQNVYYKIEFWHRWLCFSDIDDIDVFRNNFSLKKLV